MGFSPCGLDQHTKHKGNKKEAKTGSRKEDRGRAEERCRASPKEVTGGQWVSLRGLPGASTCLTLRCPTTSEVGGSFSRQAPAPHLRHVPTEDPFPDPLVSARTTQALAAASESDKAAQTPLASPPTHQEQRPPPPPATSGQQIHQALSMQGTQAGHWQALGSMWGLGLSRSAFRSRRGLGKHLIGHSMPRQKRHLRQCRAEPRCLSGCPLCWVLSHPESGTGGQTCCWCRARTTTGSTGRPVQPLWAALHF